MPAQQNCGSRVEPFRHSLTVPSKKTIELLLQRFGGATPEMLNRVLTPYRLRVVDIRKETCSPKTTRAEFRAEVPQDVWTTFEEGTTGKVVPRDYVEGSAPWKEVIKGRILRSLPDHVEGELYFDSARFATALSEVQVGDFLEVDPFGVTSKVESALCEAAFFLRAKELGFRVTRMPENVAKHVGTQNYFDFRLEKGSAVYRVELKSLWGTDTTKARLIHTVSRDGGGKNSTRKDRQIWSTSSCRFKDQDIFAVSMWLRTGQITEFAYSVSVSEDECQEWGLPKVPAHPLHVTQNPAIPSPPSGPWTTDLLEACQRVDVWNAKRKRTRK